MEAIIYRTNEKEHLRRESAMLKTGDCGETKLLRFYPQEQRQQIIGFGGAFTESAGYVFSKMSGEKQEAILENYFGESGNRYNLCRTHIQSCDFSLGNYAYVEDEQDKELKTFSLERDKQYLIPLIQAALKKKRDLQLLASPWSPPAFMKTNGQMNQGGHLKESYIQMWANMIAKYLLEYRKLGIPITRITVQNEPKATQTWDSCLFTAADERNFVCGYLRDTLNNCGLTDVKINIWDHNKERMYDRAMEAMSTEESVKAISGVAFHWYTGDHFESLKLTRDKFPTKELIMTEGCVEYSKCGSNRHVEHAEMYAHDIIGDFNAGANGYIDWNLLLDQQGGPNHKSNYCDSPVMCDPETDTVDLKLSFFYIGHFSRFIRPGARSVVVSRWSDCVETAGFVNPDGEKVLIILNRTDKPQGFTIFDGENTCAEKIGPHSILTVCW